MLTERGAALLIASAFAWLAGRFLGVAELYLVAAAAAALVGLAVAAVWLAGIRVEADRTVTPERVTYGGRGLVTLELRNRGRLATGLLLVQDEAARALTDPPRFVVPGLSPGGAIRLDYTVEGTARGRFPLGPVRVRVRDPYGLAERSSRLGGQHHLLVHPRLEAVNGAPPAASRQAPGTRQRRLRADAGDEFATIREWVPGDDIRLVHWPSSAHRARLMVRQFEQPWQPEATILLDTRAALHRGAGPASTFEHAVTAAASLAWHLDREGRRVRLALPGDPGPIEVQPPGRLMDRLAELEPDAERTLAPTAARVAASRTGGLLVAVLAPPLLGDAASMAAHPDVQALAGAGRAFSTRVALVADTVAGHAGARPAELLVHALAARGWRAAPLRPGAAIADAWRRVAPAALVGGVR